MLSKFIKIILILILASSLTNCGSGNIDELTEKQRDYVERFNVTARDIRDFPKEGERPQDYFYSYFNQKNLNNTRLFMFGEVHTDAANQLWTLGAINQWAQENDIILFEGAQAGTPVGNVAEYTLNHLFAAREYARLHNHKPYNPKAISTITVQFQPLFRETKQYLSLDILRLDELKGYYWDLRQGDSLHPSLTQRNIMMVKAINWALSQAKRVFVIAGAAHLPHYQFAKYFMNLDIDDKPDKKSILAQIGPKNKLTSSYFDFHEDRSTQENFASTRVIFEYLRDSEIPYAVLYPKNIPGITQLGKYFPKPD